MPSLSISKDVPNAVLTISVFKLVAYLDARILLNLYFLFFGILCKCSISKAQKVFVAKFQN